MTTKFARCIAAMSTLGLIVVFAIDVTANVQLNSCNSEAAIPEPTNLQVVDWLTNSTDDQNQEGQFDAYFLGGAYQFGIVGTPFNGVLGSAVLGGMYYQPNGGGPPPNYCTLDSYLVNSVGQTNNVPVYTSPAPIKAGQQQNCTYEQNFVDQTLAGNQHIPNTVFVIQLGPGTEFNCASLSGVCGYNTTTPNGNHYIITPYYTAPGQCPSGTVTLYDGLGRLLHHEYGELITNGWTDSGGNQIGDLCGGGRTVQLAANSVSPAYLAQTQQLWSNEANGGNGACVWTYSQDWVNFFLENDGKVYRQPTNSSAPSLWFTPTTGFDSALSAASWGKDRYDVFGFDANGNMGHMYTDHASDSASYDNWGALPSGNYYSYKPAVSSWGSYRLDVFASSVHYVSRLLVPGAVYHRSWDNGSDSGWVSMGGVAASAPAAWSGYWSPNSHKPEVDVFVLGTNGDLYWSNSTDGTNFSSWTDVGHQTGMQGNPTVTSWGSGCNTSGCFARLDVFLGNSGGTLSHYWVNETYNSATDTWSGATGGTWDTWYPPGGTVLTGDPSVISQGDQRLLVLSPTTTGSEARFTWDWGTSGAVNLGTVFDPKYWGFAVTPTPYFYQ